MTLTYLYFLLAGTLYGFLFGLMPVAGAVTALLTIYSFIDIFRADPYTLVIFTSAVVVSCSIGDLFSSIVLNIPGGAGSAATMVDGFPMSKNGEGARALAAGLFSSSLQGLFWGSLVFLFLPFYSKAIMYFGIPEMLAFLILAFSCIVFLNNNYWIRGLVALGLGIFAGYIGMNPNSGAERFTGGWFYLADGIQIVPVIAGLLAIPELVEALVTKPAKIIPPSSYTSQIIQGLKDTWDGKKDSFRSGFIGGFIGLMPGIGGSVVDWIAYSQTVLFNKNEKISFGEGNIKGVVGAEGAGMAQKSTAYIPTVIFGIPAAPFEVIIMSLLMLVGIELGTPMVLTDQKFFDSLTFGFLGSLVLTLILGLLFIKASLSILKIPLVYYVIPVIAIIIWSSVQYTGGWEDYVILAVFSLIGLIFKYFKINRAAFIVGFVLSPRLEKLFIQFDMLYNVKDLVNHPLALCLIFGAASLSVYGIFFNKSKISYS